MNTRRPRMRGEGEQDREHRAQRGQRDVPSRRQWAAPSTAAASYSVRSTPASPAMKIIMSYGAPRQMPDRHHRPQRRCPREFRNWDGPTPTQPRTC